MFTKNALKEQRIATLYVSLRYWAFLVLLCFLLLSLIILFCVGRCRWLLPPPRGISTYVRIYRTSFFFVLSFFLCHTKITAAVTASGYAAVCYCLLLSLCNYRCWCYRCQCCVTAVAAAVTIALLLLLLLVWRRCCCYRCYAMFLLLLMLSVIVDVVNVAVAVAVSVAGTVALLLLLHHCRC